jgi:gas vesicle protein
MRDDDGRYIVIERDSGIGLGSFVLGALLGAGVALLLTPRTGEETQEELRERARELRERAEVRVKEAQKNLEGRISTARDSLQGRVEQVREAVDAGRQAAQEYRGELEDKLERSKAAYRAGVDAAREEYTLHPGEEAEAGDES